MKDGNIDVVRIVLKDKQKQQLFLQSPDLPCKITKLHKKDRQREKENDKTGTEYSMNECEKEETVLSTDSNAKNE